MAAKSSAIALMVMLIGGGLSGCSEESLFGLNGGSSPSQGYMDANSTAEDFRGFSWVREGMLAGMPRPADEHLAFLEDEGIEILFSLTETPTDPELVEAHGMELVHIPVQDFTAPTQAQLLSFLEQTQAATDAGMLIGVHCLGGRGRTGTFLAAWFIYEGMSADEALAEIRRLRPGSVETASQEQALHDLEYFLRTGQLANLEDLGG